jgi:hypothetical protein
MLLSELVAYCSDGTQTRLNLTGRKVLHVKETTDQIDRLVRAAASPTCPFLKSETDQLIGIEDI